MTNDHGFHRLQSLASLPDAGLEVVIEAKPSEKRGLAHFLDIPEVAYLRAALLIQRWRDRGVRVSGTLDAAVTQNCVATLDPVQARVRAAIDRKFLPETMLDRDADPHELLIDPDGEDPPEPLPASLDLGDLVAEELALNLDPYPRKAGIAELGSEISIEKTDNPFAVLKGTFKS